MAEITLPDGEKLPARRIDELDSTVNFSLAHEIVAMREGITVKLSLAQVASLINAETIPYVGDTGDTNAPDTLQQAIDEALNVAYQALSSAQGVDAAIAAAKAELEATAWWLAVTQ